MADLTEFKTYLISCPDNSRPNDRKRVLGIHYREGETITNSECELVISGKNYELTLSNKNLEKEEASINFRNLEDLPLEVSIIPYTPKFLPLGMSMRGASKANAGSMVKVLPQHEDKYTFYYVDTYFERPEATYDSNFRETLPQYQFQVGIVTK